MPNPAQQPEQQRPKIEDKDIDDVLKGIEEHDVAKAREAAEKKEREIQEALGELTGTIDRLDDKRKLEAEIETAFDKSYDKPAVEADQHVEDVFGKIVSEEATPEPESPAKRPVFTEVFFSKGEGAVKNGLSELMRSRKIDVVLENYSPEMAKVELFEKPYREALEPTGLNAETDLDKLAGDLVSEYNPAYARMDPEAQASARETIRPMIDKTVKPLLKAWGDGVLEAVKLKLTMLEDNQKQLEHALVKNTPEALKLHQESIVKNRQLIKNAKSLLADFPMTE